MLGSSSTLIIPSKPKIPVDYEFHKSFYQALTLFALLIDIRVQTPDVFLAPGESVHAECIASIGPDGTFQKRIEWRRSDGTQLPDGVYSQQMPVVGTGNDSLRLADMVALAIPGERIASARLVIESAELGHSGEYSCFTVPTVQVPMLGQPITEELVSTRVQVSGRLC
ncbi:unnamed protein product [Protopolystoma xenopodis]|uniref:Ig-like domain-containing protein n=1 Tax=Protopolystoma xenopodis TaxID=117903 RepID=A0A3S5FCB5_9PLAT|nr:unnamed protein product [Protopolystoma xenopodis]